KTAAVSILNLEHRRVVGMDRVGVLARLLFGIDKQGALYLPVGIPDVYVNAGVPVERKPAVIHLDVIELPRLLGLGQPVRVYPAKEIGKRDAVEIVLLRRGVGPEGF